MRSDNNPRPPLGGRVGKKSCFYESSENFSGVRTKAPVSWQ
jgi:hypothetical protein